MDVRQMLAATQAHASGSCHRLHAPGSDNDAASSTQSTQWRRAFCVGAAPCCGPLLPAPSQRRRTRAHAVGSEVLVLNAQGVYAAGVALLACSALLYNATRREETPCEACDSKGGVTCFACGGEGRTESAADTPPDALGRSLGLTPHAADECRICRGSGLILCKRCGGKGFC